MHHGRFLASSVKQNIKDIFTQISAKCSHAKRLWCKASRERPKWP